MSIERAKLTVKLKKIASAIEAQQSRAITFKNFYGVQSSCDFSIEKLWVFGSWARGAPICSDLDLLVKIKAIDGNISDYHISKQLKLGLRNVDLHVGDKNQNSAGIKIKDTVLIWSKGSPDFEKNIHKVRVNPSAKRFERKYDSLPLGPKYFNVEPRDDGSCPYENLVDLEAAGILSWQIVEYSELDREKLASCIDDQDLKRITNNWGKDRRILLPYILKGLLKDSILKQLSSTFGETAFYELVLKKLRLLKYEHLKRFFHIYFSRLDLPDIELLNDSALQMLIVAPKKGHSSSNFLWIITRGENHPLKSKVAKTSFYVNSNINSGEVDCYTADFLFNDDVAEDLLGFEIYSSFEEAKKGEPEIGIDDEQQVFTQKRIAGKLACAMLASAEIISWNAQLFENSLFGIEKQTGEKSSIPKFNLFELMTLLQQVE